MKLTPLRIAAGLGILLLVCLAGLYCSSSSEVSTPKADQYGNAANVAHQDSTNSEAEANKIGEQVDAVERQREEATKTYEKNRKADTKKLSDKRKRYEEARDKPVGSIDTDLDILSDRERKLLADLRELQR